MEVAIVTLYHVSHNHDESKLSDEERKKLKVL